MSKILELKRERATVNASVQALAAVEAAGTALSVEQLAEFGTLSARFADLTAQIDRAEAAERMNVAAAVPVEATVAQRAAAMAAGLPAAAAAAMTPTATAPAASVPAQPREPLPKGAGMARMVRALAAARGDARMAANIAMENGFGADVAASLNTLTPGAGGVLIPQNLSAEVIELLRPVSVVRKLGARTMPLPNGNLTIPRLKGGAVVGYIGSDTDMPVTNQSFDDLQLSAKKMAALVPLSNDLLKYSGVNPNVDAMVVTDMTLAIGSREDKAFIRDDGTANTPKGARFWALAQNVLVASDGTTIAKVDQDLNKMILLLENANANMVAPGWMMAPRTKRFLMAMRDGNGNKVYPELDSGNLRGYPVGTTTQIPTNLGDAGNESEIYFVDFADCFIGEAESLEIDYSKEATYTDSDGKTVSAFQRDQTLIRVIAKNDFGPRHVESIAVMSAVTWGA